MKNQPPLKTLARRLQNAAASRNERKGPNMLAIKTHHVVAAFFIGVTALSTGLLALAIALASTGGAP
jgi:hypothetical protein